SPFGPTTNVSGKDNGASVFSSCERDCNVVCENEPLVPAKLMSTIARRRFQKTQVVEALLLREKKLLIARSRFYSPSLVFPKGCLRSIVVRRILHCRRAWRISND